MLTIGRELKEAMHLSQRYRTEDDNSGTINNHDRTAPSGPVFYDTKNAFRILWQCHGSTWPKVLPYCVVNVAILFALVACKEKFGVEISGSPLGHTFGGLVVSFLLVSRISSGLARYSECRVYIEILFQETRELIQKSIVFSRRGTQNNDQSSKEWRFEVTYRALLMLRTTAANIEYPGHLIPAYEVPELSGQELERCRPDLAFLDRAQIPHSRGLNSLRTSLQMAQLCRETICSHKERLPVPMIIQHEMNLLASIDHFMAGYYGMRKFLTAPMPFPLVQMAYTLGLLYVFSLPMVFIHEQSSSTAEDVVNTFVLTYGFIGLALTAAELDDPFGNDPNDFDVTGYARFAMDDALIMVHDADGVEWADALRYKLHGNAGQPIDIHPEDSGLIPSWAAASSESGMPQSQEKTPLMA